MKYFKDSEVLRNNGDKLEITWHIEDEIEVSIFSLIDGYESLIGKVKGKNKFITNEYCRNKRCLYILKADNYHYEVVGERLIPLDGTYEFRDLGGYKSEDGRRVRWNIFYRSDRLSSLSDRDIDYIKSMKVKTILDLRSKTEIKGNRDFNFKDTNYINISMLKSSTENLGNFDMMSLFKKGVMDSIDIRKFIKDSYKDMLFDNLALKKLIECIENEDSLPIIYHCSDGKDRAGLSSLIILSILSVPRKVIKEDYLLSNYYKKDINKSITRAFKEKIKNEDKIDILESILEVKEEYLDEVFNEIDKRYGSMDNYLEKEYGLTRKKRKELKNRLLY